MASSVLLRSLRRRDLASGSLSAYKTLAGNAKSSLGATYSASKWAALARPFCSRPPANEVIGIDLGTTNEGKNPRVIENSEGSRTTHSIAKATRGLTQAKQIEPPKISFAAKEIDPVEWKGDMLAVAVTEKDMAKDNNSKFQNPLLQKLDSQLHGLLSKVSVGQDFTGKSGQSTFLILSSFGIEMVGLVGLGSAASPTAAYRSLGKAVAAAAKSAQASNVAIALASSEGLSAGLKLTTASAIASGTVIGTYEDTRFKSKSKKPTLKSVDIIGLGVGSEIEKKFKQAEIISSAVIFGKNLANAPANVLTPVVLAEEARRICSMYSDVLTVNILNEEQCKELKMGAYLAVAGKPSS